MSARAASRAAVNDAVASGPYSAVAIPSSRSLVRSGVVELDQQCVGAVVELLGGLTRVRVVGVHRAWGRPAARPQEHEDADRGRGEADQTAR
jgi:hypothetical protein